MTIREKCRLRAARWLHTSALAPGLALILATGTGLVGIALPATAAFADGPATASVSVADVVLGEKCHKVRVAYQLQLPAESVVWDVEVQLYRSQTGGPSAGQYGNGAGSPTGEVRVDICSLPPADRVGVFQVRLKGSYSTADQVAAGSPYTPIAPVTVLLRVRKAATSTRLTASTRHPRFDQIVRFGLRVRLEVAGGGYVGFPEGGVTVQVRAGHRWADTRFPVRLRPSGTGRLLVRWNTERTLTLRLLTRASENHSGSASRSVTIDTR